MTIELADMKRFLKILNSYFRTGSLLKRNRGNPEIQCLVKEFKFTNATPWSLTQREFEIKAFTCSVKESRKCGSPENGVTTNMRGSFLLDVMTQNI